MPTSKLDIPKLNYRRKFIINLQNKLYKNLEQKNMPDSISSIIIFAQEKLGDAILLLPFLNALHKRFPDAIIDLCCTYYNKKVFEFVNTQTVNQGVSLITYRSKKTKIRCKHNCEYKRFCRKNHC